MAERGATPTVAPLRRRALKAVEALFTPLLPDDYLELINPLWSTRELRGRIVTVTAFAVSGSIRSIRPRSSRVDQRGLISSR